MADYVLVMDVEPSSNPAADDVIVGTEDADTVTGHSGGYDRLSMAGGDDLVEIDRVAYFARSYYEIYEGAYEVTYDYEGTDGRLRGVFDGGDGVDTLSLWWHEEFSGLNGYDLTDVGISLRDVTVTNFEILETRSEVEVSLAQLAGFTTLVGDSADVVRLALFGDGGSLDLAAKSPTATQNIVDARDLTDGLTLTGSDRRDEVFDSAHDDRVTGGAGDDIYHYSGGVDDFAGGAGTDGLIIDGTGGPALVVEFAGSTVTLGNGSRFTGVEFGRIVGSSLADRLTGGSGDDDLSGGDGADVIRGGDGKDRLYASVQAYYSPHRHDPSIDELHGGAGDDTLGTSGNDLAFGDEGDDQISGAFGGNTLRGGLGDDLIWTDGGDTIFGDEGDDMITLRGGGAASVVHGGDGDDEIGVDVYSTASDRDRLYGDDGDDLISGGNGNEWIDGGRGADDMRGGRGDDTYVVDRHGDVVVEAANGGTDTIEVRYSMVLQDHVENLRLTGGADANGWGNAGANILTGNAGDNLLTGRAGADLIFGGDGADTFRYVSTLDSRAATGIDTISDFDRTEGDRIDVSAIDADVAIAGDQAFTTRITGTAAFDAAGQYRWMRVGTDVLVDFNVDGDADAELTIRISGTAMPQSTWFVL